MIQSAISLALATVALIACNGGPVGAPGPAGPAGPFSVKDFVIDDDVRITPYVADKAADVKLDSDGALTIDQGEAEVTVSVKGHPSKWAIEMAKGYLDGRAKVGE